MTPLYRQQIIDLYKNPLNFGELEKADLMSKADNPLCGDRQQWFLKFSENPKDKPMKSRVLHKVRWTGEGCVISKAAASLLSEALKGKTLEELQQWNEEKMMALLGTRIGPGRLKCLMLPLETLKKAPNKNSGGLSSATSYEGG